MALFDAFKEKMFVVHATAGLGQCIAVTENEIVVAFVDGAECIYDRGWFERYPKCLEPHRAGKSMHTDDCKVSP